MALIPISENQLVSRPGLSNIQAVVPKDYYKKPDYAILKKICTIDGFSSGNRGGVRDEAHDRFMTLYPNIFSTSEIQSRRNHLLNRVASCSFYDQRLASASHVGRSYASSNVMLRGESASSRTLSISKSRSDLSHSSLVGQRSQLTRPTPAEILRKLLKLSPVRRTRSDNCEIFETLKGLKCLRDIIDLTLLRELANVALLETINEKNISVKSDSGFYVILHGNVLYTKRRAEGIPAEDEASNGEKHYSRTDGGNTELRAVERQLVMGVYDYFGSFIKTSEDITDTGGLVVRTLSRRSEFLFISKDDYDRISKKVHLKERNEKIGLLKQSKTFCQCPTQSLLLLSDQMKFTSFSEGAVLGKEGSNISFAAVIKSGTVTVEQNIEINQPRKRKLQKVKVGELSRSDSFGLVNILNSQPLDCTLTAVTPVEALTADTINALDSTTQRLFKLYCGGSLGLLSKEELEEEYTKQELERSWAQFRHQVVEEIVHPDKPYRDLDKWFSV